MPEIIAEIGWNHMGDLNLAKEMITQAKKNGATFAKFQTWSLSRLRSGPWDTDGRREIYEKAELQIDAHHTLKNDCERTGIRFLSSVFSVEDAVLLAKISRDAVKIPSFEITNIPLLELINETFGYIYLSTGAATMDEVETACRYLDVSRLTLLHCVSVYPCSPDNANLTRISRLREVCSSVGFSDHVPGIEVAKMALEFDIDTLEKHFTTDQTLPGRDNKFAITPNQLKELTSYIADRESALTSRGQDYQEVELDSRNLYRGRFNG